MLYSPTMHTPRPPIATGGTRPRRRRKRAVRRATLPDRAALGRALARLLPLALPVLVALALRLAVVPSRLELDVAPLIADEGNYIGIAQTIAQGEGVPDRWAWLRPPGYPLILAGLIRLYGRDLRPPLLLQAVVGTLMVAGVAALAGQLWGRRAALIAAWLAALSPSLIYYTRIVHTEIFYAAAIVFAALVLARYTRPGASARPLAASAILLGLAALLRPAIVAPLPFLIVWLLFRRPRAEWRVAARHALLFAALLAATIAPNALHNWRAYARLIPLDTTLGYIFWLDHRDISRDELIDTLAALPNPGDRQRYALAQGLAWIAAHPRETVAASASNLRIFWGEPPYVVDALEKRRGIADGWRQVVNTATLLAWLPIVPLAIVAACRASRRDPLVPPLLFAVLGPTLGVALSHHENRYLVPAAPLLIALAAGAFTPRPQPQPIGYARVNEGLGGVAERGHWREYGGALVATALISLFLLNAAAIGRPIAIPRAQIAAYWLLARAAETRGLADAAQRHDDAMLAWNPRISEPDERRARRAYANGDPAAALLAAASAIERDPENFRARALAGMLLRDGNQPDATRQLFARASSTAPATLDWAWAHPTAAPPARLTLDGTDLGFVRGFYGPEQGEGGRAFRWMGAHGQVRLAPNTPAAGATLLLTVASPRGPATPPVEVTISVDGRALGRVTIRRELGWNELRLPLPPDLDPARPLHIDLRATTIQREEDWRALALALASIAIEPAP